MHLDRGAWVVVVDGGKFLLFRNTSKDAKPVLEICGREELSNPPTREQGSDRPGRSFSSGGAGTAAGSGHRRSSYGDTDWHRQAKVRFANHVAGLVEEATKHEPGAIVVIAPAQLLGDLRKHYGADLAHRLQAEIAKDLAGHTIAHIVDTILDHEE